MSMVQIDPSKVTVIPANKIEACIPRVAAYCRVSTDQEEQDCSFETQVQYYKHHIASNPDWQFAGVYAERVSGTDFDKRTEFNRMMADARAGKFDTLLTKSISRFGRNILPFLTSLNELAELGVTVYFDMEGFDSTDPHVRQYIATAAVLAQQESIDKSEAIKWGIRRNFEKGKAQLNHTRFLGYTKDENGKLVVVPEEAEIVRLIFRMYLEGNGVRKIKKHLERNGIKTVSGKDAWSTSTIDRILSNEKYVGRLVQQKTFVADPLTHKQEKNVGQLPQYCTEDNHEAVVSYADFVAVQEKKESSMQREAIVLQQG